MAELILHHYDPSPYSEKIRLILGFKNLAWRSVQVPMVMPKPDLTALTGGYRLAPVLQIGADIYCDSKLIANRLEQECPAPSLYGNGDLATVRGLSFWVESMFAEVITVALGRGLFPEDFLADRARLVPGGFDANLAKLVLPAKLDQIREKTELLETQLADGRTFLLGDEATLADFAAYHTYWLMNALPGMGELLTENPRLASWIEEVAAFGHGTRTEMTGAEALAVARTATPVAYEGADGNDPNGRRPGDRVQIFPEAYGRDPVVGEIVFSNAYEIAIRRHDERAGDVVVHFPREGFLTLSA